MKDRHEQISYNEFSYVTHIIICYIHVTHTEYAD